MMTKADVLRPLRLPRSPAQAKLSRCSFSRTFSKLPLNPARIAIEHGQNLYDITADLVIDSVRKCLCESAMKRGKFHVYARCCSERIDLTCDCAEEFVAKSLLL